MVKNDAEETPATSLHVSTLWLRVWGVIAVGASCAYIAFLVQYVSERNYVWSVLFIGTHILFTSLTVLLLVNNWTRRTECPTILEFADAEWPKVAVVIPLYREPIEYLQKTVKSVFAQDYPSYAVHVIVSADCQRDDVQSYVEELGSEGVNIYYNRSPDHDDPRREKYGTAKAGNLNCAFEQIKTNLKEIQYIETRDMDDVVSDTSFLKYCISYLMTNESAAFVQTIKEAEVDRHDTFNNLHAGFYRHIMLSKYASDSLFPCGSGVVFRKAALDDVGGFNAWNLVEDYTTGISLARAGWGQGYLPIVGAVGQTAPEDIPNNFKQRGTWAIDSVRYWLYGKKQGLSIRQRLQFFESGVYYSASLLYYILILAPILSLLFDVRAAEGGAVLYTAVLVPYTVATFVFVAKVLGVHSVRMFLRYTEDYMVYLNFVFFKAALVALVYGPNRKPHYNITRKDHSYGIYIKYVAPQVIVAVLLVGSAYKEVITTQYWSAIDYTSLIWATIFALLLFRSIKKAWYGVV